DPVIFCEPKTLYFSGGEVPEAPYTIPLGRAAIARPGSGLTLVGAGKTVEAALTAAQMLAGQGIDAEVVDLRTLSPLDEDTILGSLAKTGYLVVADEAPPRCGLAADVVALAVDRGFDLLRGPVKRVTAPHTPVPFSPVLEDAYVVTPEKIVAAAHAAL